MGGGVDNDVLTMTIDRDFNECFRVEGLSSDDQKSERLSPSGLRVVLARKAFEVVAQHFFRPYTKFAQEAEFAVTEPWEVVVFSEALLSHLKHFFRVYSGTVLVPVNVLEEEGWHRLECYDKHSLQFVECMAHFLWSWTPRASKLRGKDAAETVRLREEMQARIDTAKEWVIDLLIGLKKVHILDRYVLESISNHDMLLLRKPALTAKISIPGGQERQVKTMDEAVAGGSYAAGVWVNWNTRRSVRARLVQEERLRAAADRTKEALRRARAR